MAIRIFKNLTTEIGKKDDNILKKRNYRTKNTYYKGGIKIDKYLPDRKQSNRYWCLIFVYASLILRILEQRFSYVS